MTAAFVKGKTFSIAGDHTVNAVDLHQLIEAATVGGISRENLQRPPNYLALVRDSRPTDLAVNEPWVDSTTLWLMTKRSDGIHVSCRPGALPYFLHANSTAVQAGHLLSTKEAKDPTTGIPFLTMGTAANRFNIVGVAAHPLAPGGQGVYIYRGLTNVKFESSEAGSEVGDLWGQSMTDGLAGTGSGFSHDVMGVMLSNISAVTLLATCLVRR